MGADLGVDLGVYVVVDIDLSVEIIWVVKNENYTSTNYYAVIVMQCYK